MLMLPGKGKQVLCIYLKEPKEGRTWVDNYNAPKRIKNNLHSTPQESVV